MTVDAAVVTESGRAALPDTPYKGLTPYRQEDAAFFFGRHVWAEIVTDNLKAYRLTLLYGESGVGKSSLLRAGVAHRLGEEADRERAQYGSPGLAVLVFSRWQGDVEANLVEALDAVAADDHNGHGQIADATLDGAVERCARRCGGKVFLILDQFEEYFVYHPIESADDRFTTALPRALGRRELPLSVVISIREDAVARLDRFKSRVPNLFDNSLRLEHLERAAAREAIERPVERWATASGAVGPTAIEPLLVDAVLDEVKAGTLEVGHGAGVAVSGAGAEVETPYLQLVMSRLWAEETRAGSAVIRLATLRRLGGAHGIVGTHLENAMAALEPEERDIAASAFRYLVTRSRSKIAHSVTDLADWTEVPPEQLAGALERLSRGDARILRPVGEGSYEIYHDVLADAILAWRAAHEASKRLEEERRLSLAALRRRVARFALVLGVIAFGAVALLAWFANRERNRAQHQEKLALSREFAIRALTLGRTDQDVGLWLAVAAWQKAPTPEALTALRRVVAQRPVRPPQRLKGAAANAFAATYNADGTRILVSGERAAELWDAGGRHRIAKLESRAPSFNSAFSADGSRVLTAGGRDLWVSKARDGAEVARLRGRSSPFSVARINSDGSLVAVLRGNRVMLWRIPTGRAAGQVTVHGPVDDVEFAGKGSLIVYGRRSVTVWRPGDEKPRAAVPVPRDGTVVLSPDAQRAVVMPGRSHTGVLLDVASGRRIARLPADSATFSRQGRRLITLRGSRAMVWNAGNGRLVGRVGARSRIDNVAVTRNGRVAALVLADGAITRWDVLSGSLTPITRSQSRSERTVQWADIGPYGRHVVWTTFDAAPSVWTAPRDAAATVLLGAGRHELRRIAFDPNGDLLAATGADGRVWVWRVSDGRHVATLTAGHKAAIAADFDADGTSLLTADADGTARLWNVASRRPVTTMRTDGARLRGARFSPDRRLIVIWDEAGRAAIWRTGRTRPMTTVRTGQRQLFGAAFSRDGRRLATANRQGARVWEVATGRPVVRLHGLRRYRLDGGLVPYPGVEFNRDGSRVLMLGRDGGVRLWDASGRLLVETRGRRRSIVNHALFSPDGRYVAAGNDNGAVDILDAGSGKLAKRLSAGQSEVAHIAFSPDGKSLAGMGSDGVSRIWDVDTGDRLSVTAGPVPFSFYWAAFTPDGTRIVTSRGDQAVRIQRCVWCLTPPELVALAKQSAQRRLTARERRDDLHED
jgi:WD40 repeat protein